MNGKGISVGKPYDCRKYLCVGPARPRFTTAKRTTDASDVHLAIYMESYAHELVVCDRRSGINGGAQCCGLEKNGSRVQSERREEG